MWEVLSSSERDGTGPSNTLHDQSGTGQSSWYQAAGCPSPQVSRLWSRSCHQLRSQSLLHRLECQQPIVILYVSSGPSVAWSILGWGTAPRVGRTVPFHPRSPPPASLWAGHGEGGAGGVDCPGAGPHLSCPVAPASFPATLSKQGGSLGTRFLRRLRVSAGFLTSRSLRQSPQ